MTPEPEIVENEVSSPSEPSDMERFFEYLETSNGHEIATRALGIVEELKTAANTQSAASTRHRFLIQAVLLAVVIVAATILAYADRFSSELGVLLGTMVGYAYGKRD